MSTSFVYMNLRVYRTLMNLLYRGGYKERFDRIWECVEPDVHSVVDLCFADTFLAERCRAARIRWTGVDLNPSFCRSAREKGFDVIEGDLFKEKLPEADLYILAGSLYQFSDRLKVLFDVIFSRTRRLIISEPVRNLSESPGILGWLARHSADPGSGHAKFRFNRSLMEGLMEDLRVTRGLETRVVSVDRDFLADIRVP